MEVVDELPEIGYHTLQHLANLKDLSRIVEVLTSLRDYSSDPTLENIVNNRDELRRTWLHSAIFQRSLEALEILLLFGADCNMKCHGTPCLHLILSVAVLPGGEEFGPRAFSLVLDRSDVSSRDDQWGTIMHVAAEYNLVYALQGALSKDRTNSKRSVSVLDSKDRVGFRPVHRAVLGNALSALQFFIAQGANLNVQAHNGFTPLHLAGAMGYVDAWKMLVESGADAHTKLDKWGRNAVQHAELNGWRVNPHDGALLEFAGGVAPGMVGTAVITHPLCRQHATCAPSEAGSSSSPPENTKRLTVLIDEAAGVLRSADLAPHLAWVEECKPAAISDVLRVHEWTYVRKLQHLCSTIHPNAESERGLANLDGDTTISRASFQAAVHGAGAVCDAVDRVISGQVKSAFCAVRPPGHHAG